MRIRARRLGMEVQGRGILRKVHESWICRFVDFDIDAIRPTAVSAKACISNFPALKPHGRQPGVGYHRQKGNRKEERLSIGKCPEWMPVRFPTMDYESLHRHVPSYCPLAGSASPQMPTSLFICTYFSPTISATDLHAVHLLSFFLSFFLSHSCSSYQCSVAQPN